MPPASSSFRLLDIRLNTTLAFAQRPSNPHSEYLEVVASHRRRCCKKTDLHLALFCKPLRSESVPIHYPSSPVVLHDSSPASECGELKVTQRIPTPKSTSFETHEYVPETQQHLRPRGVLAVRDKWWSRSCTTRLHGGAVWNGRTEWIRFNPSINYPPLWQGHLAAITLYLFVS